MNRRQFGSVIGGLLLAGCAQHPASAPSTTTPPTTIDSLSKRLHIRSTAAEALSVELTLTELDGGRVAYNETARIEPGTWLSLDAHFEPNTDYRFTMRIDETTIFERHIYSYAGYELTIRSTTTVEVTEQIER